MAKLLATLQWSKYGLSAQKPLPVSGAAHVVQNLPGQERGNAWESGLNWNRRPPLSRRPGIFPVLWRTPTSYAPAVHGTNGWSDDGAPHRPCSGPATLGLPGANPTPLGSERPYIGLVHLPDGWPGHPASGAPASCASAAAPGPRIRGRRYRLPEWPGPSLPNQWSLPL